ncbi:MAG: chemotaxis-specific protein-glutamate methyltransferase CheB [Treponema sp.]|jgi:two-component system chemotaxis response regulator CheB|nr:chemotaxis-specific protein-glutamate methyltransferase CheB [Treponema sp.]
MVKTLIVDDSALVRTILKNFLESDSSFEVIGEAENGREGVEKALELNPDLITMDIEMPVMGGLDAISEIKKELNTPIVVISTYDTAKMAYEATVKGAMEFYAKDIFARNNFVKQKQVLDTLKQISGIKGRVPYRPDNNARETPRVESRKIDAVVLAASTGGPKALSQLCAAMPGDFPVPVIMVQHNSSGFDRGFAQWLDTYTPLEVRLAEAGDRPGKGEIYVAPTGRHLLAGDNGLFFNDGEPVNNQKPAADLLFRSAARVYQNRVISVVLTGMGCDGADGTRYIKKAGGITIAQDEESSLIYGMPKAAVETGCVDMVLPLDKIPSKLVFLARGQENC